MRSLMPKGKYGDRQDCAYRSNLKYLTLAPYLDLQDRGAGSWTYFRLDEPNHEPFYWNAISMSYDQAEDVDFGTCRPDQLSQVLSTTAADLKNALYVPSRCLVQYQNPLAMNQPFIVFIWSYQVPVGTIPPGLPFARIFWGAITDDGAVQQGDTIGCGPSHPYARSQWALDVSGADELDKVWLHWDYVDKDPDIGHVVEWRLQQECRLLASTSSPRAGVPIAILVEPRPPVGVALTDLTTNNTREINAYTLPAVEEARDNGVEYGFWRQGYLNVQVLSGAAVYVAPVYYASSGTFVSDVIDSGQDLELLPKVVPNTNNAIGNPDPVGTPQHTKIPGMEPTDTSIGVVLLKADKDDDGNWVTLAEGDLPVSKWRYQLDLLGDGYRTPFVDVVSVFYRNPKSWVAPEECQATGDVLGLHIRMSLEDFRRTGDLDLKNTEGKWNFLLQTDAAPVKAFLWDDVLADWRQIFHGYVSHASQTGIGPGTEWTQEQDYKPADPGGWDTMMMPGVEDIVQRSLVRKIHCRLDDRWKRLDYQLLDKHMCWAVDFHWHNFAIWYLMVYKAGLDPDTEMDTPKLGITDPDTHTSSFIPQMVSPGSTPLGIGGSRMLLSEYDAETPTWVPSPGESVSSFVTRIHEAAGMVMWEMFFDPEGKFYYQPVPDRRTADENLFTFVEHTADIKDDPTRLPIMGQPVEDLDFSSYVNQIFVAGQLRKFQEVTGQPPVADNPLYDTVPLYAMFEISDSWENPDYEFYVGEKRPILIVNPCLVTREQLTWVCMITAYKFCKPRRTWKFKSYYMKNIRPNQWGTMIYNGITYKVRLTSMDIDLTQKLGGTSVQYMSTENISTDWLADYEIEMVYPWEKW